LLGCRPSRHSLGRHRASGLLWRASRDRSRCELPVEVHLLRYDGIGHLEAGGHRSLVGGLRAEDGDRGFTQREVGDRLASTIIIVGQLARESSTCRCSHLARVPLECLDSQLSNAFNPVVAQSSAPLHSHHLVGFEDCSSSHRQRVRSMSSLSAPASRV
jgi:hypothetical protein